MLKQITSKTQSIRRRLRLLRFYRGALWGASIAAALMALFLLADKIYPVPIQTDLKWGLWGVLTLAGLIAAAGYATLSRLTLFDAALAADVRLGLRERLSSAIALGGREGDPAVDALLEDAVLVARRIQPSRDFPFLISARAAHHLWPFLGVILIHFLVPQFDLFSSAQAREQKRAQAITAEQRQKEAERIEKIAQKAKEDATPTQAQEIAKYSKELEKLAADLKAGKIDEKAAIAEMSRVGEQVRLERQDIAKKSEAFQKATPSLQSEFTRGMQKEMQNGEFQKAAEMAKDMAEKMSDPQNSTAAEKEQMANDLKNMAEQLKNDNPKTAEAMQQAAEAMQKAAQAQQQGNQQAAREAMAQARQAMQQVSQQMLSQAEAAAMMQRLDQMQQSLDAQRRQMAQCMSCQGSQGREGEQGQGDSLEGQGEGRRQGQGRGQMRTGQWQPGATQQWGNGMGGPGRGRGGEAQFDDSNKTGFVDTKPPGVANEGEIIASMSVDGPAQRGDSKVEYQQAFTEYRQKADDSLQRDMIPAGYRGVVRDYFDAISPEKSGAAGNSGARSGGGAAGAPAQQAPAASSAPAAPASAPASGAK